MALSREIYRLYYDKIACHYYDLLMRYCFLPFGGERKCRDHLIEHIEFSPGERIMDMCCGTGGATFAIARRAQEDCNIVGMDLSLGQITIARRRQSPNIEFIQGDAAGTQFGDGCFDKVFITHALHEMTRDVRLKVLAEARRILKPGGKAFVLELDTSESLLVRLFAGFWFFYWLPLNFETRTRRDMLKHGLANEVRQAGFRNVRKISKYRGALQIVEGEK